MQMVLFRKNAVKLLAVGLALMTNVLQANGSPIELRRNNTTAVINGNGNPLGTGVLDDVRVGGIHHRGQRRNIQDLTVTGTTYLWGDTTVGRLDAQDHLKRSNFTVYGDSIVRSQTDRCEQRREGWVPFDVHKDCLLIKFCSSESSEFQPSTARLGAAWIELYYCGTCCNQLLKSSDFCCEGEQHEIVFLNRGIMMLPCKSIQVGECTTFDLGTFVTPTLPAECGVVKDNEFFLQPCMSYDLARNAAMISLVPNLDNNPFFVCQDVSGPSSMLMMPKLGDSCHEDDARINAFCEDEMPYFFGVDVDVNPCDRLFAKNGSLFYRVVSCDVIEVKAVPRAKLNEVIPCAPEFVCGETCCTEGQVCFDGGCTALPG